MGENQRCAKQHSVLILTSVDHFNFYLRYTKRHNLESLELYGL